MPPPRTPVLDADHDRPAPANVQSRGPNCVLVASSPALRLSAGEFVGTPNVSDETSGEAQESAVFCGYNGIQSRRDECRLSRKGDSNGCKTSVFYRTKRIGRRRTLAPALVGRRTLRLRGANADRTHPPKIRTQRKTPRLSNVDTKSLWTSKFGIQRPKF